MNTIEKCESSIRNGWIAALISLGITFVFSAIGFFTQSSNEKLNYFLDPWLMVDVVLIGVLAFFIYKKSRVAATLMFLYFLASKILQWYELNSFDGLILTLVFLYFYFNAMWGTFVWHSKYKSSEKNIEL